MSSRQSPSEKKETLGKLSVPLTTNQRSRLISTESDISTITASSGKSTPIRESAVKSIAAVRFYFSFAYRISVLIQKFGSC